MPDTHRQPELLSPSEQLAELFPKPSGHRGGMRTGAIIRLMLLLAVIFVVGGVAGWLFHGANSSTAGTTTPTTTVTASALDAEREAVVAKLRPTVVEVSVTLTNAAALGSGVIIDGRGYIVTNNHVVSGALTIQVVLSDGTKEPAQLTGADASNDLAVLKIAVPQGGLSVATLGNSSQLRGGEEVLAFGNPLGDTGTVTNGIVSALKRTVSEGQGGAIIHNAIQTDAPINPGNSGGALVDLHGNVVGIPTLTAIDPEFNTPANGVGFAIPSDRVKVVVTQFIPPGSGG
jgi:S1-C subfamily serine protease